MESYSRRDGPLATAKTGAAIIYGHEPCQWPTLPKAQLPYLTDRKALLQLFGATLAWPTSAQFARAKAIGLTPTVHPVALTVRRDRAHGHALPDQGPRRVWRFRAAMAGRAWLYALCNPVLGCFCSLARSRPPPSPMSQSSVPPCNLPPPPSTGWCCVRCQHRWRRRLRRRRWSLCGDGGRGRLRAGLGRSNGPRHGCFMMAAIIVIAQCARPEMLALAAGIVSAIKAALGTACPLPRSPGSLSIGNASAHDRGLRADILQPWFCAFQLRLAPRRTGNDGLAARQWKPLPKPPVGLAGLCRYAVARHTGRGRDRSCWQTAGSSCHTGRHRHAHECQVAAHATPSFAKTWRKPVTLRPTQPPISPREITAALRQTPMTTLVFGHKSPDTDSTGSPHRSGPGIYPISKDTPAKAVLLG